MAFCIKYTVFDTKLDSVSFVTAENFVRLNTSISSVIYHAVCCAFASFFFMKYEIKYENDLYIMT